MSTTGWQKLARDVKDERRRRRQTQREFGAEVGLSERTVRLIEAAARDHYSDDTYDKIERALRWLGGSVERVASGLKPIPMRDVEFERLRDLWPALSLDARRILLGYAEDALGRG